MRIHIIGGSGSGKTYVADLLSARLGIPHYDLDDIFWANDDPGYGTRNAPEVRARLLAEIVDRPDWIIEGAYYAWLASSFDRAERIFVLTPGIGLRNWRVLRRFIGRRLGLIKSVKKETWRSTVALMRWNAKYDRDNLPKALKFLTPWMAKVVKVRDAGEVLRQVVAAGPAPR